MSQGSRTRWSCRPRKLGNKMPDIPGANWPSKIKVLPRKDSPSPNHQLNLQMQRLEGVKEQLQDLQTQLSTLAGVVDVVMDRLYDLQVQLSEDK